MSFQRARSAEQREERRRAILDTAAGMLREGPVADLTLTALARRACLAKSAVLRYFDSREAVLLELLGAEWADWLAALAGEEVAPGPVEERREAVAELLARTVAARPVLGDLAAAQAAVLERNVSPEVAARFKRSTMAVVHELAALVRGWLPELDESTAFRFAGATTLATGAVWAHGRPSVAMLAAYEADPALAALRLDVGETLRELLAVLLAGFLVRRSGSEQVHQ